MSPEPTPDARETGSEATHAPTTDTTAAFAVPGSTAAVLGTSALAVVAVAVQRGVSILANVPFDPTVTSSAVRSAAGVFALVAVVAALVAVAVTDERATVRVGLLFAAVFGPVPLVAPGTALPAVVAVVGGGGLALVGTLGRPATWTYRDVRRRVVAVGFVAALAVTLAGATGLAEGVRNTGAFVTLAAVAAVGTRAEGSLAAALVGLLAAGAVVVASAVNPFVVASALLVAFAVTGVPSLLVGLAAAGAVAATVAGLSRDEYALAVGAALLLLAGVPATFPRALALLLGAALVLGDVPRTTGTETGVSR